MQVRALGNVPHALVGNEMGNISCKLRFLGEGDALGDSGCQSVPERGTAGRQEWETGSRDGKGERERKRVTGKEKGNVGRRVHADGYQRSCSARGCCGISSEQPQPQMTHLKPFFFLPRNPEVRRRPEAHFPFPEPSACPGVPGDKQAMPSGSVPAGSPRRGRCSPRWG